MTKTSLIFIQLLFLVFISDAKVHHLKFKDEIRRNILLTKFGYGVNSTLEVLISNFTVPEAVIKTNNKADKFVSLAFLQKFACKY